MEHADLPMEEDGSSSEEEERREQDRRKQGVRRGTKRGPYRKTPPDARHRIECFQAGGDWKVAAATNGVPTQTAYGYITKLDQDGDGPRARGGSVSRQVEPHQVESSSLTLKPIHQSR